MFKDIRFALVGLALVASVPMAQAATVTFTNAGTFGGNDCSGNFGQGFANCAYNGSPIIAKFNYNENGTPGQVELNTAVFPGLQASWFTINAANRTWVYNPTPAGPGITAFVAKASNEYILYTVNGGPYFGGTQVFSFNTPLNNQGHPRGLSHISFYDTRGSIGPTPDATVIPVPAALPLMLSGLVGFGLLARRRRSAA